MNLADEAPPDNDPALTGSFDESDYDLGGEAGGEDQLASDDPFFVSRQAAAVFKHKLIQVYFPKFAGKAGSTEADRRLAYVDTHAGRGAYDDGTPGSPLLIAQNVANMAHRRIDCFFVERKPSNYEHLYEVLKANMPPGAIWETRRGAASDHLDEALAFAADSPLFVFVDPYGLGPTFPEVVRVLKRKRAGYGSKTELLLNFISAAFGRAGGYLQFDEPTDQQRKTLEHLDEVLDGPWWRHVYLRAAQPSDAVEEIAETYAAKVSQAAGCRWTLIPVKNRAHHVPLYWLVHFTHHPDGQWWIREAAAQASQAWRRYCNPPPSEEGVLFAIEDPFPAEETARQTAWVDAIERNARELISTRGRIDVRADARDLFGDETFGLAWAKHLRQALDRLYKDGSLVPKPYAAGIEKYVGQPPA